MKTKPTTRVTFSAAEKKLSVSLPHRWEDLSDRELRKALLLMTRCDRDELLALLFMALTGAKVVTNLPDGSVILRFPLSGRRRVHAVFPLDKMTDLLSCFDFLTEPGSVPVRPDTLRGRKGVHPRLYGLPFGEWLKLENFYKGWADSGGSSPAMAAMAAILYPADEPYTDLRPEEENAIALWLAQIKGMLLAMYPRLYANSEGGGEPDMKEIMNRQIRALSEGDITREEAILSADFHRALTELQCRVEEAESLKQKFP